MFSIVVSFCCLKGTIGIIPVQVRVQKMFSSLGLEIVVVSVVVCVVYSVTYQFTFSRKHYAQQN